MSPASPTISPLRTLREAPSTTFRPGWLGLWTVQSSMRSASSPIVGRCGGKRLSRSRPTIPEMIRSSVTPSSAMSSVSIVLAVPDDRDGVGDGDDLVELVGDDDAGDALSRSPRSRSSRCAESSSLSAAVGSSRMRSLTSFDSALAISTSCCLPTPMSVTTVVGFSRRPTRSRSWPASRLVWFQSIRPRLARSLPRKMFSAIDSYGLSASSWWMMTMPRVLAVADAAERARLALEEDLALRRCRAGRPRTAPSSGSTCRRRSRRRWRGSRRRRTDRVTSCSAFTPGNVLVIPRIRKNGRSVMSSALHRSGAPEGGGAAAGARHLLGAAIARCSSRSRSGPSCSCPCRR